jgi:trehalose 6-phosphate phosphatase
MITTSPADLAALVDPLRSEPELTAILCDVDGTLAPIVEDPSAAAVPDSTRAALRGAARKFGLVACVTGRPAIEARFMVGVDEIAYAGNHGLELLEPGAEQVAFAGDGDDARRAPEFVRNLALLDLAELGLRIEDKGPIQAFHWRGSADEETAAARARELAAEAEAAGLFPRWGRKVLELRPSAEVDKGEASVRLLEGSAIRMAIFGGDDLTDLDAFRSLRELRERDALERVVCVGVASEEAPDRLWDESDAIVAGTEGFAWVLRRLVGAG